MKEKWSLVLVLSSLTLLHYGQGQDTPVSINESDLNSLLNSVFPGSGDATNSNDEIPSPTFPTPAPTDSNDEVPLPAFPTSAPEDPGRDTNNEELGDCDCVPYYLCDANRTIIENGEGLIDIRIKDGPCEDYMDVCCKADNKLNPEEPITTRPTTNPDPDPEPQPAEDICGLRNFGGVSTLRITGGVDGESQFGEFPWMVAIIKRDTVGEQTLNVYQCGGSLIHPQVVLTAAHCVKGKSNLLVRAGEWDTQRKNEPLPTQNRGVKDVITHDEFYAGALFNDVALLVLESPVELAPNVARVCLPAQGENMNGRTCVATGWGKDVFGKEGKYQVIMKKVDVPTVPYNECQEKLRSTRLGKRFKLHSSFMCAGGIPGKDTCKGDGGGPLVCPSLNNPNIYVQAGIVAWGIGCGSDVPGVYVNVAQFKDWIHNQLTALNIEV